MKTPLFAALMMVSAFASANDTITNVAAAEVEQYSYSEPLDINKVISITTAENVNPIRGTVESRMVYTDHKGVIHNLEYTTEAYSDQDS
jgi:hypothetical protein